MLDNGVHRLCLLQLKEELFHGLDGIIPTQVNCHLFNLRKKREERGGDIFSIRMSGWHPVIVGHIVVSYCSPDN